MITVGTLLADDVGWHRPGTSHLSGIYRGQKSVFPHLAKVMALSNNSFRVDMVFHIGCQGGLRSTG